METRYTEEEYKALKARLASLGEESYRAFQARLIPGARAMLGVRMPALRKIAKELMHGDWRGFLALCTEDIYELTLLRALVIASAPCQIDERLSLLKEFIPFIDNWAVCDAICGSLRFPAKERARVMEFVEPYSFSKSEFEVRFAAVMLLSHFVTEADIERALSLYAAMSHEGYYAQMAIAWGISVCFVKFRNQTLALLEAGMLEKFIQNKSIQKIRESYRVPDADKELLQSLLKK